MTHVMYSVRIETQAGGRPSSQSVPLVDLFVFDMGLTTQPSFGRSVGLPFQKVAPLVVFLAYLLLIDFEIHFK